MHNYYIIMIGGHSNTHDFEGADTYTAALQIADDNNRDILINSYDNDENAYNNDGDAPQWYVYPRDLAMQEFPERFEEAE